jgi:hypothetical protein
MNTKEVKKVLHLTIKKRWFDMISSGEKKEEYRLLKRYWSERLCDKIMCDETGGWLSNIDSSILFKHFDVVKFVNGYGNDKPTVTVQCLGISIGKGREEWGAEGDEYFVIKFGDIIKQPK